MPRRWPATLPPYVLDLVWKIRRRQRSEGEEMTLEAGENEESIILYGDV